MFPDWKERAEELALWRGPPQHEPLVVSQPRSWLLAEGWKRHGAISYGEIPSARAAE